jgi:hypothetical protein
MRREAGVPSDGSMSLGWKKGVHPPHKDSRIKAGFSPGWTLSTNLPKIQAFFRSLFSP